MKTSELREKSLQELKQTEILYKEELFNLHMQAASNQLEKPSRIHFLRKGIAKIKTLLREEELKSAKETRVSVKEKTK